MVTVEPDPDNLICLKRNLAEDIEAGRVIVYEKGVWDREDELFLQRHTHAGDATVDLESGIPVKLTTVDKIVSELDLRRVDFIKMDIEGSEQRALKGAQETIRRFQTPNGNSVLPFGRRQRQDSGNRPPGPNGLSDRMHALSSADPRDHRATPTVLSLRIR